MSALYEIGKVYLDFMSTVEAGDIPEEAITDTLDGITGEFEAKADNIACMIKSMSAEEAAIKNEITALKDRAAAKERHVDRLKMYLSDVMQQTGIPKVETARNVISFRKSTSVHIENEEDFKQRHPDFCKAETVIKISKTDIGRALKSGQAIDGAQLVESRNLQIK